MSEKWEDLPNLKTDDYKFKTETTENLYKEVEFKTIDKNKINKIKLFWAVVFCVVSLPILYHNIRDYIILYFQPVENREVEVRVGNLKYKDIYDSAEVTGYITPASSVDVVARVDGYLENTYFKEGDFVTKGQLLFKIEDHEYKISVRAAEAEVAQAKAYHTNSMQELERAKVLVKENFISRSDYDSIVANADSTKATLDSAYQSLARAKLNLNYTNIYAPISGKAGKINMSNGNYVGLSSGPLVNIAKMDTVFVNFSMKSSDVLKMKQGNSENLDLNTAKVELILSNNSKYDKTGKIVFFDNMMTADAASLSIKATFDNSNNILLPGDYVRVLITSKEAKKCLMAPQVITRGDSINGYYLWTVVDNKTKKKKIKVIRSEGNAWIIENGISSNDDVIEYSTRPIDIENMNVIVRNKKT